MLSKISKISLFSISVLIALFINGKPELNLLAPFHQNYAFTSRSASNSIKYDASVNRPEIRELKIKIRYMGSECNYFVVQIPEIKIDPEIREERKFLNNVSLVNIYFLDSFHSRGPPSAA